MIKISCHTINVSLFDSILIHLQLLIRRSKQHKQYTTPVNIILHFSLCFVYAVPNTHHKKTDMKQPSLVLQSHSPSGFRLPLPPPLYFLSAKNRQAMIFHIVPYHLPFQQRSGTLNRNTHAIHNGYIIFFTTGNQGTLFSCNVLGQVGKILANHV